MENIRINNFDWTLSTKDNISSGILKGEHWEPHLTNFMKAYLKKGDVVIDIGACFGWHTLEMARIIGDKGIVYAFEPQIDNIKLLETNIEQNNFNNIIVHKVALGNKNMETVICNAYIDETMNCGDSFISPHYNKLVGTDDVNFLEEIGKCGKNHTLNKEIVTCTTLDDIKISPGKRIKFIKLDVQGFEKMVLEGGVNILSFHKPVIVIELEDPCMILFEYTSKQLLEYIRDLGYYIYFLDYNYPCDHICVPIEQIEDFEQQFTGKIHPHTQNNSINNNLINGVVKKVCL